MKISETLNILKKNRLWWSRDVSVKLDVHHVPKCMSCHKAIVVITGGAHCFHDCIFIIPILLLWDLSTMCVVDPLGALIYIYMCVCVCVCVNVYIYIYIYIYIYKYIYIFQFIYKHTYIFIFFNLHINIHIYIYIYIYFIYIYIYMYICNM